MQIDDQSPLAIGEKKEGLLFVDGKMMAEGDIELKVDSVEFHAATPPYEEKYTDID